jgi:hypothetical protein
MSYASASEPLNIQDYGIIGDCRAAALIGRNGSLDWLCWPQFDSAAIFAGILDPERGGHWQIAPAQPYRSTRRYVDETNVLETSFTCDGGTLILTDLMPVASEEYKRRHLMADHEILRQMECTRGEARVAVEFEPRVNYGLDKIKLLPTGKLGWRMEDASGVYWLRSTHPLTLGESGACGEFTLKSGERAQFSLTHAEESPATLPCLEDAARERIRRSVELPNWAVVPYSNSVQKAW